MEEGVRVRVEVFEIGYQFEDFVTFVRQWGVSVTTTSSSSAGAGGWRGDDGCVDGADHVRFDDGGGGGGGGDVVAAGYFVEEMVHVVREGEASGVLCCQAQFHFGE